MQHQHSGKLGWLALFSGLIVLAPPSHAGQTHTWTQADYADFVKGNLKNCEAMAWSRWRRNSRKSTTHRRLTYGC
jgi:hypothetical protein